MGYDDRFAYLLCESIKSNVDHAEWQLGTGTQRYQTQVRFFSSLCPNSDEACFSVCSLSTCILIT